MKDDGDRSQQAEPGPHRLPNPPIPKNVDLRKYPWMEFNIDKLLDSDFWRSTRKRPEVRGVALALWAAAWHQVPAGSLPDDIVVIADHADLDLPDELHGMTVEEAKKWATDNKAQNGSSVPDRIAIVTRSLHGFELCSDGRRYHSYLAPLAFEKFKLKTKQSTAGREGNATRWKDKQNSTVGPRSDGDQDPIGTRSRSDRRRKNKNKEEDRSPQPPLARSDLNGSGGVDSVEQFNEELSAATRGTSRRGSATTERGDWPTSPRDTSGSRASRDIDPEATAARKAVVTDAQLLRDIGYTYDTLKEALWAACADHQRKLQGNKLEVLGPILALLKDTPGLSVREDVLPAISAKVARHNNGDVISSWMFFVSSIKGWHQNRVSGAGNGAGKKTYDPENLPDYWFERAEGRAPPGHPWKPMVTDPMTKQLRRYGGHWDWEWYDALERFVRTGGDKETGQGGVWYDWFAKERPGQPGSSCPDDIRDHFGIPAHARQPAPAKLRLVSMLKPIGEPMPLMRPVAARGEVLATSPVSDIGRVTGGLPTAVAGHFGPMPNPEDDGPPF